MRGYPQFPFWISIGLVKIYISCIITHREKNIFNQQAPSLKLLSRAWLAPRGDTHSHLFTEHKPCQMRLKTGWVTTIWEKSETHSLGSQAQWLSITPPPSSYILQSPSISKCQFDFRQFLQVFQFSPSSKIDS